jgi:hypothetical protein
MPGEPAQAPVCDRRGIAEKHVATRGSRDVKEVETA